MAGCGDSAGAIALCDGVRLRTSGSVLDGEYELYRYDTSEFYDRRDEVFNTTRFRDRGGRVFRVQMLLMEVGYGIQPNSIYDLVTFAVVKDFQTKTKLLVDAAVTLLVGFGILNNPENKTGF